jgi:hypothetical protein
MSKAIPYHSTLGTGRALHACAVTVLSGFIARYFPSLEAHSNEHALEPTEATEADSVGVG